MEVSNYFRQELHRARRLMIAIACFNIKSGDVEDAPALDPLAKFDVVKKDDGVYVKGSESELKGGRTLQVKCTAQGDEKVLVIGG